MPGGYSDREAIHTREDWWTPTYKCKYNNTIDNKKTFTINAKETQKKGSQTKYLYLYFVWVWYKYVLINNKHKRKDIYKHRKEYNQ